MAIESLSTEQSPTAEDLLRDLGSRDASGVLEISHPADEVSHVWLREGRIYAMHVPGYRPALGIRLLSGGLVSPEQLSAAAAAQRDRFPTHLIGQVLVGMGLVAQEVIDAFVLEQVLDQMADLLDLPIDEAMFHPGRRIQQDVIAPTDVADLLEIARERRAHRADVLAAVGGPHSVPALGPPGRGSGQTPLGPYDWALLCRVDGRRNITELARVCGFTVQESAQIVADLALTGLLVLPEPADVPDEPLAPVVELRPGVEAADPAPEWQFDGTAAGEPEPVGELLAELSAFVHDEPVADLPGLGVALEGPDDAGHSHVQPVWDVAVDDVLEAPVHDAAGQGGLMVESAVGDTVEWDVDPVGHPEPALAPLAAVSPDPVPPTAPTMATAATVATATTTATAATTTQTMFPQGAPVAPAAEAGFSDTSVFMRELSSLSDDPQAEAPVVTRLVVPLTEQRKKKRFWGF